jgi:hypothetical protein
MTPEQQIHAWAEQMAATFEAQVKTIPDARYRARALRDILNDIRPGLSNQVTAATVALQKQGVQPLEAALHQALVTRLIIYVKQILKAGGAYDTESDLGDMAGEALGTFNSAAFSNIMGAVNQSLSSLGQMATSITQTALQGRQEREALRAREREAERQASLEELRIVGEMQASEREAELEAEAEERRARELELREAESTRRARMEEARAEREEREAELEREEAAAAARRRELLQAGAPAPSGGGGIWLALGGLVVVGGGIAAVLYFRSKGKKDKEKK